MYLPVNTLLCGGTYRIIRCISSGGFGYTYEAEHVLLEKRVAIKEFFVRDFCYRDETTAHVTVGTLSKKGLVEKLRRKFIDESKALCRLRHPGIVSVSDVFEENGTAYFVMDYIDGKSLSAIVREQGPLSEERAVRYISQVATALQYVHDNNRLHLDIKPGNIMIDGNDNPILIDFGASKQYYEKLYYDELDPEAPMQPMANYAPLEQMSHNVVNFLPATDIYALGATLYKILTGITPLDAISRICREELEPLPANISDATRNAVATAMQINKNKRPQSVAPFLWLLQESLRIMDMFDMVYVAGGTFLMGASASDSEANDDEKPAHSVTLSGYYIGKYEVTQKQWVEIMGANPSFFKGDDLPVERVSWNDVQEFIRKLNAKTGKKYRLPTEAEWEFAARGGNSSQGYKYSGSNRIDAVAWYSGNCGDRPHPVGTKSPNELGIYDMLGNVWEWCSDWYGNSYYSNSPSSNPKGLSSSADRVLRGGCWRSIARYCRVSSRNHLFPGGYINCGFRLAMDAK